MKKFFLSMLSIMMATIVSIGFTSCGDDDVKPDGSSDVIDNTETIDNNKDEGIYLGIIGFNSELYVKDLSLLSKSTESSFTNFIDRLQAGNGTGLYYADYSAIKKIKECAAPPKLKNVALVTFTDGLDNVSTASSQYDPENYGSASAYREALHNKIVNETIHGHKVSAYTIGLKGNDVTDDVLFMENLQKLASSDNNVFQVSNMNEAVRRFQEIAANLYKVSSSVNLGVDVPGGYDEGQVLRFTFDNAGTATSSNRYIEATYQRSSNGRTLNNITYHGFAQGSTSIASSSSQGAYYHFQFSDLKYTNGSIVSQSDLNNITLWKKTSTGGWDRESEFSPASSSTVTEDKSSAMIVLVLDCTTSLGNDFIKMQQAGKSFVNTLVNPGEINPDNEEDPDDNDDNTTDTHEYVDLGLPSGTLWATCNIGASSPEDYGDYFAWGETMGSKSREFYWDNYKYCMGSEETLTKYCDNASYGYNGFTDNVTELESSDDAAYVNWGSDWRMPSVEQFWELINNTTIVWRTMNGKNGCQMTSKSNEKSIFLPAAGMRYFFAATWEEGSLLRYYSRMLYPNAPHGAEYLTNDNERITTGWDGSRCYGGSIRPVRSK